MISNDIQELLKNITKSLIKIETKELDALISRQLTHIDNIDFHRYEISHRKIESLKFSFCSFRGAFISYSSFTNCNFINCSFITAIICNAKFTNCTFINCVFRSMHIQDNLISNCSFQNCHIEDNIFLLTMKAPYILWRNLCRGSLHTDIRCFLFALLYNVISIFYIILLTEDICFFNILW